MPLTDPLTLSLTDLCAALSSGSFAAVDVAKAVVERARALAHLNAFITPPGEELIEAAKTADPRTPLAGAPIAVKDNIDTADMVTTAGTPGLRDWRPQRDADVVVKLRKAGGLVAGKANLHELAGGMTSANVTFGAVANPYDRTCHGGGSSGGSAVAVAARIVPAALGSDTGGSVMNPAAMCGIWGFRPTLGRVSQRGLVPMTHSRDTVGWFARTSGDLILMDQIHADMPAEIAPLVDVDGVRIGVPRAYFQEALEPDVADAFGETCRRLIKAGAVLVEADLPGLPELSDAGSAIVLFERARELAYYLAAHGSNRTVLDVFAAADNPLTRDFGKRLAAGDEEVDAATYRRAFTEELAALKGNYAAYFAENGVMAMLTPAAQMTAKPVGPNDTVMVNGERKKTFAYAKFTIPPTTAQLPGLSVPVALSASGLPIGALFIGPSMSDGALLGLGPALAKVFAPLPPPEV